MDQTHLKSDRRFNRVYRESVAAQPWVRAKKISGHPGQLIPNYFLSQCATVGLELRCLLHVPAAR